MKMIKLSYYVLSLFYETNQSQTATQLAQYILRLTSSPRVLRHVC